MDGVELKSSTPQCIPVDPRLLLEPFVEMKFSTCVASYRRSSEPCCASSLSGPHRHALYCFVECLTVGLVLSSPQLFTVTTAIQNGQQGTFVWPEPGGAAEDREAVRCGSGADPDPVDHHSVPKGRRPAPAWAGELPELAQGWHGEREMGGAGRAGLTLGVLGIV